MSVPRPWIRRGGRPSLGSVGHVGLGCWEGARSGRPGKASSVPLGALRSTPAQASPAAWLPEPRKEARGCARGGPSGGRAPGRGLAAIPRVSVSAQPLARQPDGRFSGEGEPDVPFQTDFTAGLRRAPASS